MNPDQSQSDKIRTTGIVKATTRVRCIRTMGHTRHQDTPEELYASISKGFVTSRYLDGLDSGFRGGNTQAIVPLLQSPELMQSWGSGREDGSGVP